MAADIIYKNIILCNSGTIPIVTLDFNFISLNWFVTLNDPDEADKPWITILYNDYNAGSISHFILADSGITPGVYEIHLRVYERVGLEVDDYVIYVVKITVLDECITEEEVCCDGKIIRWLGKEGGIKQWHFPGVIEHEIRIGDAITFKNTFFQIRYAERKDIYNGLKVSTKPISKSQFDYVSTLQYSIQAWMWDETLEYWEPILLDNNTLFLYKSTTKIFEYSASFIRASEILSQTA